MDRHLERDRIALRNFHAREDSVKYTELLRKILALFGLGIIDSLTYTLGKYLRQTDGELANDKREDWEEKAVEPLLSPCCGSTNGRIRRFHYGIYLNYP
jgi:hypothetical protein